MKIRSRLLFVAIVLILGAMVAASILAYKIGASSLEASYVERLTQTRINKSLALQNDFENLEKSLVVAAEMIRTRNALITFPREQSNVFRWVLQNSQAQKWREQLLKTYHASENSDKSKAIQRLQKLPLFLQWKFQTQAQKEETQVKNIVKVENPEGLNYFKRHELLHSYFLDYAERFNLFDILLIDTSGTIVYSIQKSLNFGTNLNSGIYSNTSLGDAYRWSLGAPARSFKFYDFSFLSNFDPTIAGFFVSPVFDGSNFIGTMVFQISLDHVDKILSNDHQWKKLGLKKTGEILAIGPDGLLRNNSRAFFENPSGFLKTFIHEGGSKQVAESLATANTTALRMSLPKEKVRNYFRNDDSIESQKDYLGNETLASIGKVQLPSGPDWLIIAEINRDEIVTPLSQYLILFGLSAFILLAIVALIFFLFSKRLTKPLHSLEEAMEALRNNTWKKLPYNSKDEYAKAFENYNQLAAVLKETSEKKASLENLIHSLKELLFIVDFEPDSQDGAPRWIIRSANAAASNMIGIPVNSLVDSDLKLWIETDFKKITDEIEKDQTPSPSLDGELKKISGEKMDLAISIARMRPTKANVISFVLIATDVSRQKDIERQLKIHEGLLKSSQAMSHTGSFHWEISSGITVWSEQLFEILGFDKQTMRPSLDLFRSLVVPEDHSLLDESYSAAQKSLRPLNIDVRLRKANTHDLIWVHVIAQIEYDQYGTPRTASGVMQDVTDLKHTEMALIAAKDEALKSSQAKSEFLAHMSHEIRTPMNAIMGMADLLRETQLSEEQIYYITIFRKAGEVLMALINDILDLSKIEAGQIALENIPFDLDKIMVDIQDMMRPRALEKGIDYSFEVSKSLNSHLMGDPTKVRQVLINLVSNSIKFTERGHIRVNVTKNPTKKDSLIISVSDSGVGIPVNKQHLIFQKFSQADSSITRRYGGTGLGLTISKSLVELMGGQIWFKSREGVGTTFFFTIPLREQIYNTSTMKPMPMMTVSNTDFVSTPAPRDPNKKVRILLADDTEDNRVLFTRYLKNQPYEIIEAENGLEAVNKIKSSEFDIVFMDVQMPEMDGYAATEKVREWERAVHHPHIPIIALTAHALSDDKEKSLKAGCDDHVTKPFKKEALLKVIDQYLN